MSRERQSQERDYFVNIAPHPTAFHSPSIHGKARTLDSSLIFSRVDRAFQITLDIIGLVVMHTPILTYYLRSFVKITTRAFTLITKATVFAEVNWFSIVAMLFY